MVGRVAGCLRVTTERTGFPLRAGPLTASLDRGELRWIRFGEREVLRGIYAAVRGPGWATVPARLSALRVDSGDEAFTVSFEALYEAGALRFTSLTRIEGTREGTIRCVFAGRAESGFLKNRIGLCVLHPLAGCVGLPCVVEHGDGRTTQGVFPWNVAPHQPYVDIRRIRHGVERGRLLEVELQGEWFEMEDQRNWSDASFKTYSTPVANPLPARMEAGDRVLHEVVVRLVEGDLPAAAVAPLPASGPSSPRVGLDLGVVLPSKPGLERARALRPDHLRVELLLGRPDWDERLSWATAAARELAASLEVAVVVPEPAETSLGSLAEACARRSPLVDTFLLFREATRRSDPALLALGRRALAGLPVARVGGGTAGWFAELNRNRESARGADAVAFALSPQVHARDEATILENLASLPDLARTARGFAGEADLRLSPVTLATGEQGPDSRGGDEVGGEWLRGLLKAAAQAGFGALTLGQAFGEGGFLATPGLTAAEVALRARLQA